MSKQDETWRTTRSYGPPGTSPMIEVKPEVLVKSEDISIVRIRRALRPGAKPTDTFPYFFMVEIYGKDVRPIISLAERVSFNLPLGTIDGSLLIAAQEYTGPDAEVAAKEHYDWLCEQLAGNFPFCPSFEKGGEDAPAETTQERETE